MVETLRCDVAVIGGGTAGISAERAARKNGASTLMIDPEFNGTTCANVGCMPSKLLIAAAKEAHRIGQAGLFGIKVGDMRIDGPAVMRRVRSERDRFARLTRDSIAELPDDVTLRARARFDGPNRLLLDDGRAVEAKSIVIATGSSPALPGPFAELGDRVITSDGVFELEELPRRLAVVGSGAIGLELAQAFARLGVDVALFDKGERMAKIRCPRVHAALRTIIETDMPVHLGVDVSPEADENGVVVRWSGSHSGEAHFDLLLAALGRPPQLDGLDLEKADIELDENGVPLHDRATMRCGESGIFIAGDVASDLPLLHEASHDGAIAGRNAAALPAPIETERHVSFSIVFTDPTTASIGESEADGAVTGHADFSDQGRARVEGRNRGTLTLYAAAPDGRLIGADLVAPAGEHLAHMLAWAIQSGKTASDLLELPFYHPTIEEGLKQALRTICAATPITLPQDQDTGTPPGA
ncbi:dihydrolipoyl dehydrogenase [Stakelama tenebrarum]|uniref:Dihydrolipoyl dehydrogenase n=1 Tax=Stakelama tenebrarum TaxID=2711215 RepID=A0A6G6Y5E7_9SPHN|nr:dihydrolipoyl dehydrogenase [Sphingosinithalassobacter tenebrarum]QIG80174.1 dihydrolipoyl dehydrogenase [Sphingosinithalassobacter tenebrarum]